MATTRLSQRKARRKFRLRSMTTVGPFIFGFEATQEGLQSQFWLVVQSYRRSWTVEQVKKHKSVAERDSATPTRKKKLQQNKKACDPKARRSHSAYI
jgi:hypothetical protein